MARLPALRRLAILLLLSAPGAVPAADYIGVGDLPPAVLAANIERLAAYIARQEAGKEVEVSYQVTRMLGKEDLGQGKQRVWFCIKSTHDGSSSNACGGDIRLIRLDTGRWIIQDIKRDAWQVVQQ
jgi:hypothetical protein